MNTSKASIALASAGFVLIWSTGWIMARFAVPDSPLLTFLLFRHFGAGLCLMVLALWMRADWPKAKAWGHAAVSGILLHAGYLGCVWYAISQGMPASIAALLSAVQPILTICLAPRLLGETVTPKQWLGVTLATLGLCVVLGPRLFNLEADALSKSLVPLLINLVGMLSLTAGTLYQKTFRYKADIQSVAAIQYGASLLITLPFALMMEDMQIHWTPTIILTMLWSVLGVSVGAILLFLFLIKRNEVVKSSQLFFLVPPASAIQAYLFFGETFSAIQLAGICLTVLGVALSSL